MAMKFDKELVLKHKFWIILGLCLPFSVAAIFILTTRVSGQITEKRKAIETALSGVTKAPKTPEGEINKAKYEAAFEAAKKSIVWARAWDEQRHMFTWPKEVEDVFDFQNGLFAYEIAVEAKKEDGAEEMPPKVEEKDEEKKEEKGDPNPLIGVVTDKKAEYIMVKGVNKKDYKFRRTQNVKVTGLGEDGGTFPRIPVGAKVTVSYNKGKYFLHDTLTGSEQPAYVKFGVYHSQIDPIIRQVDPVGPDGKGVVQLKGWPYQPGKRPPAGSPFFQYVVDGWQTGGDISEEAWLAQEDLWIQKELYRIIREANDKISKFEGPLDDPDAKTPRNAKKVYELKNPYWQLKLAWPGGNKLQITITNLQNRRQKLDDVKLRIRFHKNVGFESDTITLGGEPLMPYKSEGDTLTMEKSMPENPLRSGIYEVEQVLSWESAAVKRIDQVLIGADADNAHSHRTYPDGIRQYKKEEKPADGPADPAQPVVGQVRPDGGGVGGKAALKRTKHGLLRDRYVEVTGEARRIPIAVSLIVDQDHIDRVETAFGNSKLRFLMTQVILNRYPGSLRPAQIGDAGPNPVGGDGGFRLPPPVFPKGPMGPVGGGEGAQASLGGGDEMESNVEMVIYGIITIYERYPAALNRAAAAPAPQ